MLKQLVLSFSLILLIGQHTFGQDTYKLKYATELPVYGVSIATLTAAFILELRSRPSHPEFTKQLDRTDIAKFDRSATYRWSHGSAIASDVFLYSSVVSPAFLLINGNVRKEYYTGLIYLETLLFTAGITNLTKVITQRPRPYMYNEKAPTKMKLKKDALRSFFSGHTSLTAASSFFMAQAYADLNPNSKYKPYVWTTAAIVPAITGILRYTAGKHYPSDIIVGYLVGAAAGILIPYLHTVNHSTR